jgi:hypothetical protein
VRFVRAVCLCVLLAVAAAPDASAQVSAADSAAVLLDAARDFESEGRPDVAEALYRLILERYPASAQAAAARTQLAALPEDDGGDSGSVELRVWMTLYGTWLGAAVPAAFGADSPEPYGIGLLLGGPGGFLTGRLLDQRLALSAGQARAITLGGSWGTWQGFGWREVLDAGVEQECAFGACYDAEDAIEETFGAMVIGGLAGIGAGALVAGAEWTPGTASTVNFSSVWGSWFGFAGAKVFDLDDSSIDDDDLLAATLVGGNVGLVASALLAPGWNVSRSRARLVSSAGVLGGVAGLGIDLLVKPEDDDVAFGIPLAGSILGIGIGIAATRGGGAVDEARGAVPDGALVRLHDGRLALGVPAPQPTLVPREGARRTTWHPALRVELLRADF